MLPEYPSFKNLEPENLKSIAEHLHKAHPQICELAPANLIIWKNFDRPQTTTINNNICIKINPANEPPFFLEPIGQHKIAETIEVCLKDCGRLARVSENCLRKLDTAKYRITCSRDHFDYIYETKALAELKGKKYDGKRNHIKNFKKRHPDYEYVPLASYLKTPALELFEAWFAARKDSRHFPKLAHEAQKNAVEQAFLYFEELNLMGGALFIEKEMKGFILGSKLNKETVSVHFLYGHPALRGIFQTLLWEACNRKFSGFKYINLEQDLGIPGLRKSKLSYHPLKLEKKFEVKLIQASSAKT